MCHCQTRQIIVLHRRRSGVRKLAQHMRGLGIEVSTFHAPKGLEYEVVFLSQMQGTFSGDTEWSEEALSNERRLVYMAMTRARERLYMNYEGHWPDPLESVRQYVDQVLA